jgi:hypothetical protein
MMKIPHTDEKDPHLNTIKNFYIYRESKKDNQLSDKHNVISNAILDAIMHNKHKINQHHNLMSTQPSISQI